MVDVGVRTNRGLFLLNSLGKNLHLDGCGTNVIIIIIVVVPVLFAQRTNYTSSSMLKLEAQCSILSTLFVWAHFIKEIFQYSFKFVSFFTFKFFLTVSWHNKNNSAWRAGLCYVTHLSSFFLASYSTFDWRFAYHFAGAAAAERFMIAQVPKLWHSD